MATEHEIFTLGQAYYRLRADVHRYLCRGQGDERVRLQLEKDLKAARKKFTDAGGVVDKYG